MAPSYDTCGSSLAPQEDPPTTVARVEEANLHRKHVTLDGSQDNERRKRRQTGGEMLREGVGLTTGLGWSDSEDEDAPSPLTRRLSTLAMNSTLTRKASMAISVRSANRISLRVVPAYLHSPNHDSSLNFHDQGPGLERCSYARTSATAYRRYSIHSSSRCEHSHDSRDGQSAAGQSYSHQPATYRDCPRPPLAT